MNNTYLPRYLGEYDRALLIPAADITGRIKSRLCSAARRPIWASYNSYFLLRRDSASDTVAFNYLKDPDLISDETSSDLLRYPIF